MSASRKIKILIVDDEPLGRTLVRRMLEAHAAEVEIVGEAESGREAVAAIEQHQPDLIFLDVQMPEIDGFAVLERLGDNQPVVIFVTAYDAYAVRAFETGALEYLLKPYDRKRFEQAFGRAVRQIETRKNSFDAEKIISLLSESKSPAAPFIERFIIKTNGRVFFLNAEEVVWIEAEGNYVLLNTATAKKHIFRETLTNIEQSLNPQKFRRVNRSAIVNLDFIRELQPWFRGDYQIILKDGTELKLSHRFRENLTQHLGGSL